MSKINSITLSNFKFFGKEETIELGGKHLLLYGENGSGKSSIYWALYTLLEASSKNPNEVSKYFKPLSVSPDSLVNIHAVKMSDIATHTEHFDSVIRIVDTNGVEHNLSLIDTTICGDSSAIESRKASDFIDYKSLFKFQDFKNSESSELNTVFLDSILPYVSFGDYSVRGQRISIAFEMWTELKKGPEKVKDSWGRLRKAKVGTKEHDSYVALRDGFNIGFGKMIAFVNLHASEILKQLGYDFVFHLSYIRADLRKKDKRFSVLLTITHYDGKKIQISRPHKFLNEAKMSAIAIAIRLAIIKYRLNSAAETALKVLMLDDIMISLDMSNRDKVLNLILKVFSENYQLLFFTHDKSLFSFVNEKIDKNNEHGNWLRKAVYIGENEKNNAQYPNFPVIIDEECDSLEKAKKYYQSKDYVVSALYIRQSLEKYINDQLPKEYTATIEGKPLTLNQLWGRLIKYTDKIPQDLKDLYDQSRLMVLNPSVHYNITFPIYRRELQQAFRLVEGLRKITIKTSLLLMPKGAKLEFTHPSMPYVFCIETLQDMWKGEAENPNCRIIYWQYDGTDFYDFITKTSKIPSKPIETKLERIITNLESIRELGITRELFLKKTKIAEYGYLNDIIQ